MEKAEKTIARSFAAGAKSSFATIGGQPVRYLTRGLKKFDRSAEIGEGGAFNLTTASTRRYFPPLESDRCSARTTSSSSAKNI